MSSDFILQTHHLSKTFYTGFFGNLPYLKHLKMKGLHKVVDAVHDVNLRVRYGEIFAFLGSNGAGKSTCMKMLMGLIKPTQGYAILQGVNTQKAHARVKVGYLPENPTFQEELTPIELLEFYAALHGMSRTACKKEARILIERVNMGYAANRPLRKLSKGMHQRIGIAQALLNQPDLIILDEPLSGLDPIGRKEIREVLLDEKSRGATLFFSSHILPDVEALCDRFAVIEKGRIRHQGDLNDLWAHTSEIEIGLYQVNEALQKSLAHWQIMTHDSALTKTNSDMMTTRYRIRIPIEQQAYIIELIQRENAQIEQLAPVRPQLEDLFTSDLVESIESPIAQTEESK
jgi:ABC-2 type transport system ATP-binding protein